MPTENDQFKAKGGLVIGSGEALPAELEGGKLKASQAPAALATEVAAREAAEVLKAPLASPGLTGVPTAPTAAESNNSTQIATTAYADRAGTNLPAEAVTTSKIANLAVTTAKLGSEAVETAKIKLLAITEGLLANEAVGATKVKAEAIETGKIKLLAVTAATIASEAISTAKIAALAVTEAKIAANAVSLGKLATAVSKQIPAEHGRSAEMVAGKITIAAPAVTSTGAIIISCEGTTMTVGAVVTGRTAGTGFTVEAAATSTDRINWAVYTE